MGIRGPLLYPCKAAMINYLPAIILGNDKMISPLRKRGTIPTNRRNWSMLVNGKGIP